MQRSSLLLLIICCALGILVGLAEADMIKLKGENPKLGGIRGQIIAGAKPGVKPGEVIRPKGAEDVEIAIFVNKDYVGTVKIPWDKIESIEFTSQNASSYEVDEDLRKEQERERQRQIIEEERRKEEQKTRAAAKESEGEEKSSEKEEESFLPDEEKAVDTWISQLGLGAKSQQGRRRYAKAKLIEKGKKVVGKVSDALITTNTLLKRNAAAVLEGIGKDAEKSIPSLLTAASDDDRFVRWGVIEALRAITGKHFGYSWEAPAAQQREIVKKWQDWWKKLEEEKKKKEAEKKEEAEEEEKKAEEIRKFEEKGYKLEPTRTKPIGK
ncbi:MAG: HEAT repeat domain-containing protein [Planctomycetota bacterium]|nr:MAG: HEAT repeat domain-containing protein [Planctomycetota bacterium]